VRLSALSHPFSIISSTRPGVPTTTCGFNFRAFLSVALDVPPVLQWTVIPQCYPSSCITLFVYLASSRTGVRIRACVISSPGSILYRIPIENAPVLPVPD
jgi:hypothetical protein